MNPEAFFWLMVAGIGTIYFTGIAGIFVADWRERRRVKRIMKGS